MPRTYASTLASSTSARATVVLDDANEDILRAVGAVGYDPEAPMSSGSVGLSLYARVKSVSSSLSLMRIGLGW